MFNLNTTLRVDEAEALTLKAKMFNMQNANQTTSKIKATPKKFIDGHMVISKDSAKIDKKLMNTCKEFESLFVNMLYKQMRSTINTKNDILHGGQAEEIFSDMLYQEYSKLTANAGDFGIAKVLYEHFTNIKRT